MPSAYPSLIIPNETQTRLFVLQMLSPRFPMITDEMRQLSKERPSQRTRLIQCDYLSEDGSLRKLLLNDPWDISMDMSVQIRISR